MVLEGDQLRECIEAMYKKFELFYFLQRLKGQCGNGDRELCVIRSIICSDAGESPR